jgi:type IV pilus assembly protein PilP
MSYRFHIAKIAVAIATAATLSGCAEGTLDDLRQHVATINARAAPPPEPLPPMKPYNVYTYSVVERDPFRPFFEREPERAEAETGDNGIKPDLDRNTEELEGFPLDALRMVGTLERDEAIWAVVVATDETIHRVQIGNRLGENHGKIVNIQEDRVDLIEIARDARGRWQERAASIALQELEE